MLPKTWHDRLLAIGFDYVSVYEKGLFRTEMLAKLPTLRKTILLAYASMVDAKELVAIESLPAEEKQSLWNECRPFTRELKKGEVLEFVKCYHALNRLAEMKAPF